MNLIKDERTGKTYKTPFNVENDSLYGLYTTLFVNAGVLTESEAKSMTTKCIDKWPFIKSAGKIDGRTKIAKSLPYFTWRIILEK